MKDFACLNYAYKQALSVYENWYISQCQTYKLVLASLYKDCWLVMRLTRHQSYPGDTTNGARQHERTTFMCEHIMF